MGYGISAYNTYNYEFCFIILCYFLYSPTTSKIVKDSNQTDILAKPPSIHPTLLHSSKKPIIYSIFCLLLVREMWELSLEIWSQLIYRNRTLPGLVTFHLGIHECLAKGGLTELSNSTTRGSHNLGIIATMQIKSLLKFPWNDIKIGNEMKGRRWSQVRSFILFIYSTKWIFIHT